MKRIFSKLTLLILLSGCAGDVETDRQFSKTFERIVTTYEVMK